MNKTDSQIFKIMQKVRQREWSITDAKEKIIALLQEDKWIPVEKELPKDGEKILVYYLGDICQVKYKNGRWHRNEMMEYIDVKHWQPIPKPPTEEK